MYKWKGEGHGLEKKEKLKGRMIWSKNEDGQVKVWKSERKKKRAWPEKGKGEVKKRRTWLGKKMKSEE